MLLAIDIGNTNVTLGVYNKKELLVTWRMETNIHRMPDEYAVILMNLLNHQKINKTDVSEVSLCSVVPPLIHTFEELFRKYFDVEPLVIGPGVKTGVRIRLDNPKEAGADRIVHAAAAHHLYGGPIIVVDMGTATTFDTVSKEGDHLGGAIAPGIATSAEALFARAAQLYRIQLIPPKHAIGTSTVTALQSGIIFGYVGLVEGIVHRIQSELSEKAKVIATGGNVDLIVKETRIIDVVNPDLVLEGLRLIYEMNRA
jgi:type III pantothenate kinase